ncbi:MAG TPA: extracellular solute-binding protein, partial [Candidatus Blautia ornithocaccae]|nr:extracellular solute-binding protein [Candidatus Blautia pullistercoris]HJD38135.1 extracellular solute-binding protein [Candidatus Blautia ornithocaccae]
DLRMLPSFYQMMIEEGRIEDLRPYIEGDEEWKNMIEPSVLDACSEEDGSIYLAPISTAMFACSGVFWNQELFQKAGIEEFPETWEEFWDCCDRLEDCGITPLALHTEGTAWAPMLLATAELADSQEGADFMKKLYPDSYQNASGLHLAETLQKLFSYTTEDALHTDFDVSYRNFISEETAMIPNGYWMIDQIPEDMVDKIRFSPFPGNKLVGSPETFGWAVVSSYSQEVKEGAIEFLKFRTMLNKEEKEKFLEEQTSYENQIVKDYVEAYKGEPQLVPNYQVKWNSVLQEETLGEALPKLVQGDISPEEFTQMEDESIREFEEER